MASLVEKLKRSVRGDVKAAELLSQHTTLRVGGPAVMVWPQDEDDLRAALAFAVELEQPPLILGNGSNLLVKDSGYAGMVIKMSEFNNVDFIPEENLVYAAAGVLLPGLINQAKELSLGGLEFLWGVPASVGGAVKMNAGAFGIEVDKLITEVRLMDHEGQVTVKPRKKLDFSYRFADINNKVVLGGKFLLQKLPLNDILKNLEDVKIKREATQPLKQWSAGSIFKNPPGKYAGELIEAAGLKGYRLGGASISAIHANFIVTAKGAQAADVLDLIALAKERVASLFGVELCEEVQVVG